ncbi:MAG: hypothetical protein KUG77_15860, partial [Nannocystaceae bacterium]|nr:hypothetical protein [Nannocystaceae bacterium]
MRAAARVRSTCSPLFGALLCLATVTACDDDGGGSGTDGAEGSSGGTTGVTPSTSGSVSTAGTASAEGSTTGTTDATASSSTGDATTDTSTTGTGTSGTTDDTSDTTGDTTGALVVDVPFTLQDPTVLELTARVPAGWVLVTSAVQWASFTDAPVPAGVTFPDQWVLFGSRGPQRYPGHALSVDTLSWQGDTLIVAGDHVDPADDCETYEFIWPADTLVSFDALDGEIGDVDDQTAVLETSCAAGAADSMDCDLDSPCATGLLCAG